MRQEHGLEKSTKPTHSAYLSVESVLGHVLMMRQKRRHGSHGCANPACDATYAFAPTCRPRVDYLGKGKTNKAKIV